MHLPRKKFSTLFFKLAIPAVVAQVVNMLYNMVDRMYIGRIAEIGPIALTGIGVSMPVIVLITAFANLIGSGGAPRASMALGRGEHEKGEKFLNVAVSIALIVGIMIPIIFFFILEDFLMAVGASEGSLPYALAYIKIYLLGTPAVMFSIGINMFISAQGKAAVAMKITLIGAICNIVLDPIFIFVFKMGVQGAAVATIISQYISAVWVFLFLYKKGELRIRLDKFGLQSAYAGSIIALGLAPFIMTSTESILQITFNRSLLKYGGDLAVGTMSINGLIFQMVFLPLSGFSQGTTAITSYNYGARNKSRVKKNISLLVKVSLLYSLTAVLLLQLFPGFFVSLFTNDAILKEATVQTLHIYTAGISLLGIQISCQQSFIAFGQAKISAMMALFRKIILLIPLIYILPMFFENKVFAVYAAEPIADIAAAVVTGLSFLFFVRRELREM